jgi:hypothetical protein
LAGIIEASGGIYHHDLTNADKCRVVEIALKEFPRLSSRRSPRCAWGCRIL